MSTRPLVPLASYATRLGVMLSSSVPAFQMPNDYDICLAQEIQVLDSELSRGPLHAVCCPKGRRPYYQRPWIAMPAEGRRFKPVGVLDLPDLSNPANIGAEFTVLSARVPVGYDGVITDYVCEFNGQGFVEGSGDITWRLKANGRYLRDLGDVITTQGSLTSPNPVPRGGLRVYSYNLIEWVAVFSAAAATNLQSNGRVICSFTGWWYPR